jgi:hypothetical protein
MNVGHASTDTANYARTSSKQINAQEEGRESAIQNFASVTVLQQNERNNIRQLSLIKN